jgi:4-hydroxyphenylacetate 3-monooxygenase
VHFGVVDVDAGVAVDDQRIGLPGVPTVNEHWVAEDRRKLLAYARDLLNSDYTGHRLTFRLFAQSPPFAHLAAVYRNFGWDGPLDLVKDAAGLSDRVNGSATPWRR